MANKKLKRYGISIESETYAISLVDEPAIEVDWIYLSKQKPMDFKLDEKHIIVGPALIPDKPIYRRFEDEEFEVVFTKQSIEKMAYEFLSKRRTTSVTLDHEKDANDISVIESWIIASKNDKSVDYGFDLPIGTWMIAMKVNDDETWNRIKNGELKGFSVESFVSLDELDFSKIKNKNSDNMINVEMDEQGLLDKIKAIINDALGKSEDKPSEVIEEVVDEAAVDVIEKVEEEKKDEKEEEIVKAEEETPVEENTPVEEIVEEVVETVEENAETEVEVENELQAVVDELNAKINELNSQIEELKAENKKLGSQPSAKPLKASAEKGVSGWDMLRQLNANRPK